MQRQESGKPIHSINLVAYNMHSLIVHLMFICRLQKYEITIAFDQIGKADIIVIDRLNTCLKDLEETPVGVVFTRTKY